MDQAHVLFLHTCIFYCFVQNYVCTMYLDRLFSCTWGKAQILLYLNLNIFASKYSPTYESEVSKATQSVAPTKECNNPIFLTSRSHHNDFSRFKDRGKTALTTYPLLRLPVRTTCHHCECFRQNIGAHFKINMNYITPFSPITLWRRSYFFNFSTLYI